MTRITNFGRKRTYVEAGFDSEPSQATVAAEVLDEVTATNPKNSWTVESRKRTKQPKLTNDNMRGGRLVSGESNCQWSGIHSQGEVDVIKSTLENKLHVGRKAKVKNSKGALDLQIGIGVFLICYFVQRDHGA
jgi:hypothetical protein